MGKRLRFENGDVVDADEARVQCPECNSYTVMLADETRAPCPVCGTTIERDDE